MTAVPRSGRVFLVAFGLAALFIAGVVSYFASTSPDGLDSATLRGCEVVQTADGEALTGDCIARSATDHHLADSPLAHYTIGGHQNLTGIAGLIGVTATFVAAGGVFRLIGRRGNSRTPGDGS